MVQTAYDEYRVELRKMLTNALTYTADKMLDPNTWGYDEMKPDYIIELYQTIKRTRDMV